MAGLCLAWLSTTTGCFVFKKKDKYGCPTDGRNIGAEKLANGDEKMMRASNKAKYKGGNKFY